ncbi:uncharacterized protein MYCFIDRAFT_171397 [Pseudocercospora fijiensis CIRAD86]|uniref:NTF2-like domain-containing protein n=1 Tax=Pseudocercospora fijiensis (strain CIRAD86) TaxID=383855 RepID=M3B821_PSEFD|nr:uncharacterized protein MYCFIDRAFT_171397 [Pseudocercospora fijiensis CIRAD86]EME85468.1 hypothetical protein MYCFIDRAFT_171397 [Pseudocercospora fijiensis CIRAD86]
MHSLVLLTTFIALATATPTTEPCNTTTTCLTQSSAEKVADNFAHIFSDFTEEFANQTLAIDVTDQTDSVCWLISNGTDCPSIHDIHDTDEEDRNRNPLQPKRIPRRSSHTTESSISDLELNSLPPSLFQTLTSHPPALQVFTRWKFDIEPQAVQGIAVLQVIDNTDSQAAADQPYLIKNIFSEFNTGAFLVYRGDFVGTAPEGEGCAVEKVRRGRVGRMSWILVVEMLGAWTLGVKFAFLASMPSAALLGMTRNDGYGGSRNIASNWLGEQTIPSLNRGNVSYDDRLLKSVGESIYLVLTLQSAEGFQASSQICDDTYGLIQTTNFTCARPSLLTKRIKSLLCGQVSVRSFSSTVISHLVPIFIDDTGQAEDWTF